MSHMKTDELDSSSRARIVQVPPGGSFAQNRRMVVLAAPMGVGWGGIAGV